MKRVLALAVASILIIGLQGQAAADDHTKKVQAYLDAHVASWLASDELHRAVYQQNLDHMGLSEKNISDLDKRWRAEKLVGGGSLMASKLNNELAAFLRGIKAASGGVITEIFVMDNKGLNVGQTNPTGDYMQGDESKWKETFGVSSKSVLIDAVEEEDGINVAQASLTIARSNGYSLGAVTIGINVDALK